MSSAHMQNLIATFFFVAYMFLVIVAICGSVSIIFIVLRYRNLRSRPINFYYMNMAFADLFLASLGAPFRAMYFLHIGWPFGAFICNWFEYAENLGYFVHGYSLMVASFLVLQDVILAKKSYRRNQQRKDTCLRSSVVSSFGVWSFGIVACLPYAAFRKHDVLSEKCLSNFPVWYPPERVLGPIMLVVAPVLVTVVTIMILICCACTNNARVISSYQENELNRAQKSCRHISLLMLIFICCQIPFFALKWLKFDNTDKFETIEICAAGLRLATACFSAAFFCYISEEKVLYNVRHAVQARNGARTEKMPLRSVSDIQAPQENTHPTSGAPRNVATNGTMARDQPQNQHPTPQPAAPVFVSQPVPQKPRTATGDGSPETYV